MRGGGLAALAALLVAFAPAQAVALPEVHAHRGGSVVTGEPRYPENSMSAFRASARRGFVLELDVKLTRDRVPVVLHDATLDRTSDCAGRVSERTLDQLRGCRLDVLGSPGSSLPSERAPRRARERIPRLDHVLRLARRKGSSLNLEIKNVPTDADFDAGPSFAERVMQVARDSGLPRSQLIVQSFWPPNLDVAARVLPRAERSLLTQASLNAGGPAAAAAAGYQWVSPAFDFGPGYVEAAHALGRRVVPYTLNGPRSVERAADLGVDALISDDPVMARRTLRRGQPEGASSIPPPPSRAQCRAARAARTHPLIESFEPRPRAPRVFAMQFKQELAHVADYAGFRTKIECMIRDYVRPQLARRRPNVVAFNEDVGLMTIATGDRGAAARGLFGATGGPGCEPQGVPCATLGALAAVTAAYAPQVAAYRTRFPAMAPVSAAFVAATDTFARGWMQVFSDMARRYDVYIVGSNNQARFRESSDPAEVALFADPSARPRPRTAFVATSPEVYNEVFMWGPRDVRQDGPRPLRNVVARNSKVPLTSIEEMLQLTPGPRTGPDAVANVEPYRLPGTRARIAFATSLPAFVYGPPPARGVDPCSDTARWYMRCLDRLGANLVIQDEANPGRWAADAAQAWQPLEWMTSTWRAAADPAVEFDYNVTPHMVGNLADLAFDGQTAITQRGLRARRSAPGPSRCTYVGNRALQAGDRASIVIGGERQATASLTGPKREFLAIAPWIDEGPRARLRRIGARLAPGSGDPLENDYLETAIAADLPFPPVRRRPACAGER